ncbi:MAG: phosphoglycerate kinase [Alphaproteobacteria bacterium]|nr:MAG: phosphoglycerate kinase [Alphaproteobacteria bacterium]
MSSLRTLDGVEVRGKRVLIRCDFNVPVEDGKVTDRTRITRSAATVREIADKAGKAILLSHFGRPKERNAKESLKPLVPVIADVLGRPVAFAEDCIGGQAMAAVEAMRPGDVLCLENTRFHKGEERNDAEFVAQLAAVGDLFVNDAFSASHRAHASVEGLAHLLPAYAGRALQEEVEALAKILEAPARPLAGIVGGAKISTKLDLLGNLLDKVDTLIIGGGMANTFLAALGKPVGKSLCERDLLTKASDIVARARSQGREIVLPVDTVVAHELKAHAPSRQVPVDAVQPDEMILDIGRRSIEHVCSVLARTRTLVWNGPFGAFEVEPFDNGTIEVAEAAAELASAGKLVTVAGGGDTVAALNAAHVADRFTYVSTAGGAFLEWLEGKPLPGVEVLKIK